MSQRTSSDGVGAEQGSIFRGRRRAARVLQFLGYGLVVLVLAFWVPGGVRAADPPSVTVGPAAGIVGSTMYVNGTGFIAGSTVTITFNDSAAATTVLCAACAVSASGNFSDHYAVPASTNGSATVAAYEPGAASSATYVVYSHQQLSLTSGPPLTVVTVTGTGFDAGAAVAYRLGTVTPAGTCNGRRTTAAGGFRCTFDVPYLPYGTYAANATDNGANLASNAVNFSVVPGGYLSIGTGFVGSTVTVFVDGFPAYAPLQVIWDPGLSSSVVLAAPITGGTGVATTTVTIPASAYGAHTVEVYYSASVLEEFSFDVVGSLTLPVSSGYVGETGLSANGNGLPASSTVTLLWDPGTGVQSTLGTATTSANGAFTTTFTVPSASRGVHTISAMIGGVAMANASFTIIHSNLTLAPVTGPAHGLVTATLVGFAADSATNVIWDTGLLTQSLLGNGTTTDLGGLTLSGLTIPATAAPGVHLVTAIDASGNEANATFVVGPWLTVYPVSGAVDSSVSVSGSTFPSGQSITLHWNSTTGPLLATVPPLTGSAGYPYGNFTATITIPVAAFGTYLVYAVVAGTSVASASLSVVASLAILPTHGPVGTIVKANATGLAADKLSTLSLDGTPTGLGNVSSALGIAWFLFAMPPKPAGGHDLLVTDANGDTTNTVVFTVDPSLSATPTAAYPGQTLTVDLTGFAADSTVTLAWDGTGTSTAAPTAANGSGLDVAFTIPSSAAVGNHTLGAWDLARNIAPAITITVLALPTVLPSGPANNAALNRSSVTLLWNAVPKGGVTYTVEVGNNSSFSTGAFEVSGLVGTAWTSPPLADGRYYWAVEAVAPGGATAGFSAVRSFVVDTVAPTSWVGSVPSTVVGLDLQIPFTASDPSPGSGVAGVELLYSLDSGHDWVAYDHGALFVSSPIAFVAPVPGLYEFQTLAVDHAGNHQPFSTSGQASVRFEPAATTPNYAPYVFVISLAVLAVVAVVYLLRHRRDRGPSAGPRPWSEAPPASSEATEGSRAGGAGPKEGP